MDADALERHRFRAHEIRSETIACLLREGFAALLHAIRRTRRAAAAGLVSPAQALQPGRRQAARQEATHTTKEQIMSPLNPRERELVALGAAMGSNCVPCIEYHIPQARKAGLSDAQISEAIQVADRVRQVPARKVLEAASAMLAGTSAEVQPPDAACAPSAEAAERCCG